MSPTGTCRIAAGSKVAGGDAGAKAICTAVEQAIAQAAPKVRYSAEIKVLSASTLSAKLSVNGGILPEQHFAVMDGVLKPSSIERFAEALAGEVAKAVKDWPSKD